jgi:S-DNA-T family DNA segregation ATPase FtsK/SpoIIIE
LGKPINRIGRSIDADIVINDPAISRIHAEITIGTEVILRDLNSTNGVWLNNERISQIELTGATKFNLGSIEIEYK